MPLHENISAGTQEEELKLRKEISLILVGCSMAFLLWFQNYIFQLILAANHVEDWLIYHICL